MRKKSNPIRSCPVCSTQKSETLFVQRFSGHFSHKIVSCRNCGFVYVNNTPPQSFYNEYYRKMSKYDGTRQHENHFQQTYRFLSIFIHKHLKPSDTLLDIGCSTGQLLYRLKKIGYSRVEGFDPSSDSKRIAYKKYKLDITTANIDTYKSEKKFDFIIISQVLEHLQNVRASMAKVAALLTDGGYVFIGVPDVERFTRNDDEPYGELSTEHINFFSQDSLRRVMVGYSCVSLKSDGHALLSIWKKGSEDKKLMLAYIEQSEAGLGAIRKKIEIAPSDILVWGAGALTQRLLETTNLQKKVLRFVDSDRKLQGRKLSGIKIISPTELYRFSNPILISSFRFRNEIVSYIKAKKYKNEVISF